jgi:putative addiction module killer protein
MVPYLIREYLTEEGKNPYRDWLSRLDKHIRVRIQARIMRFEQGNFGDCKAINHGVWEARLMFGAGYRIYYALENENVILLLLGGDKQSQAKDIKRAQTYWTDYQSRSRTC